MRRIAALFVFAVGCAASTGPGDGSDDGEFGSPVATFRYEAELDRVATDGGAPATRDAQTACSEDRFPLDEEAKPCASSDADCFATEDRGVCAAQTTEVCAACIDARIERCRMESICNTQWTNYRCCSASSCPGGRGCAMCATELMALEDCRTFAMDEDVCTTSEELTRYAAACAPVR